MIMAMIESRPTKPIDTIIHSLKERAFAASGSGWTPVSLSEFTLFDIAVPLLVSR
jgi:hypothetical protein